jgi:hypothetical protein
MNLHAAQSFLMRDRTDRNRPHRSWFAAALATSFGVWRK